MLVAVHFPLTDVRPLLATETYRLTKPAWPNVVEGKHFIRSVGVACERLQGGSGLVAGESVYCLARNLLRLPSDFSTQLLGTGQAVIRPYCAFRRLFLASGIVSRYEVGVGRAEGSPQLPALPGEQYVLLARSVLDMQVRVPSPEHNQHTIELRKAGGYMARCLLHSTTKTKHPDALFKPWWLTAGAPLVLLEHQQGELSEPPRFSRSVEALELPGIQLHYTPLKWNKDHQTVGLWFMSLSPGVDPRQVRQLRIHLVRAHAELQSLKRILMLVAEGSLVPTTDRKNPDPLQAYLHNAYQEILKERRSGIPQRNILDTAYMLDDLVHEGDQASLLTALKGIRGNLYQLTDELAGRRAVQDAPAYEAIPAGLVVHVEGNASFVYNNHSVSVGNISAVNSNVAVGKEIDQQSIPATRPNAQEAGRQP